MFGTGIGSSASPASPLPPPAPGFVSSPAQHPPGPFLPGQLPPQPQRSGQRRRTRCLDEIARRADQQSLRRRDLVVADEDEVVEPLPEDLLRELECRACRQTLGERLHPVLDEALLAP